MKITKAKYNWLVAQYNYRKNKEEIIEISDEEYRRLTGNKNPEPEIINEDINNLKTTNLTIEALSNGQMIIDTNKKGNGSFTNNSYNFNFKINHNGNYIYKMYNSSLSENANIYTYDINKGDIIEFYNSDTIGTVYWFYPEFTFNYKLYGNILTYKYSYLQNNNWLNENILNINDKFNLILDKHCLSYKFYVPENFILSINGNIYLDGYEKSHETDKYIFIKNEKIFATKGSSYYMNNIYYYIQEGYDNDPSNKFLCLDEIDNLNEYFSNHDIDIKHYAIVKNIYHNDLLNHIWNYITILEYDPETFELTELNIE